MSLWGKVAKGVGMLSLSDASTSSPCFIDGDGDEFYEAESAILHPDASDDGGLACNDKIVLERQRSAIMEVMKSLAKNLLTGNLDLLKTSLPVKLFEPRSYLQKLADPWVYPHLMQNAVDSKSEPAERLKWVVSYMVAGYHRAFRFWAKPFNPILGETWQAHLHDGTQIFMEQVSHHPPISAIQMFGPHRQWVFHGQSQPTVTYKTNTIKTAAKGYRRLEFSDGTIIDMVFPHYYIKGLLYTSAPRAELGGTAEFIDRKNGVMAIVHFGAVDGATVGSLLARPDAISGTIYRTKIAFNDDNNSTHSSVDGDAQFGVNSGTSPLPPASATPTTTTPGKEKKGGLSAFGSSIRRSASQPSRGGLLGRALSLKPSASSASVPNNAVVGGSSSSGILPQGEVRIPLSRLTGNWLSHVDWDGDRYWTLTEDKVVEWTPDSNPLPSDCRYREDLIKLAAGDLVGAQTAKEALENQQRAEAKLRKQATR